MESSHATTFAALNDSTITLFVLSLAENAMNVEESIFPRKKENQKEHELNNDFVPDTHEKRIKIEHIL